MSGQGRLLLLCRLQVLCLHSALCNRLDWQDLAGQLLVSESAQDYQYAS